MKSKTAVSALIVLALTLISFSAIAAETNFKPANMSGAAPAQELKSKAAEANAKGQGSEFWAKEFERSGFKKTSSDWGQSVKGFFSGNFFKEREDEYLARKGSAQTK